MNRILHSLLLCLALTGAAVNAAEPPPPPAEPEQAQPATPPDPPLEREDERESDLRIHIDHNDNVVFNAWGTAHLPANDAADGVIAIFGDANVEGEVYDAVVTIFGNARVTGEVHGGVVSIFGNTYIDGPVQEAAVSIFGDLELGPHAEVDGDVAVIAGRLTRDPGSAVRGTSEIMAGDFSGVAGLRLWIEKCLMYARPLAFDPGLWWAWVIAFGFLLFYVVISLLFDRSVTRCVETLETQPGQTTVASIMTMLLVPVLMVLLVISVVGIAILPFAGMAVLCATLFGKAVVLAALGRRLTRFTGIAPLGHVAFATFVGGLMVLVLYVIPVIGLVASNLLGIIGLGVVAYTILLSIRQRSANRAARVVAAPAVASVSDAPASTAATMDAAPATEPAASPAPVPPPVATALPRAGFWIRMGALFIDIILIAVIAGVLDTGGEVWLVILAAYGALMWKFKGTTIGGLVCGIKVVRRDGAELNWDTAIVRALGCFLSMVVAGLGFLWIVFDEDRQAWHDKIAGTLVVRTTRPESLV
jgi:uncharacterized RDD family membrane protein YckC